MRTELRIEPIGMKPTPLEAAGTPNHPSRAKGARGWVYVEPAFREGLQDLKRFERVCLVYPFCQSSDSSLHVRPFLNNDQCGVFATRAPVRPSPVDFSKVRLLAIPEGLLEIADADIIDAIPLPGIKPYAPRFDRYPDSKAGWFTDSNSEHRLPDSMFQRDSSE